MNKLKEEIKELVDKEENEENLIHVMSILRPDMNVDELLRKVLEKSANSDVTFPHSSIREMLKNRQ